MYSQKKDGSDYIKFLATQSLWIAIFSVIPAINIIGLLLAALSVYGNVTGKYFDLPLVGALKLFKY
jgi:uncharacterized membrane protein